MSTGELDDHTALFVVSDHGFLPSTQGIRVNVRLRQLGVLPEARFVANLGAGYLYMLGGGDRQRLAHDLVPDLRRIEGVNAVWPAADYANLGLATPSENPLAGDLVLEASPGYCFEDEGADDEVIGVPRYRGTHGQRQSFPDNGAFFLTAGPGIVRGARLPGLQSRDVAPTLAHLFGLAMENSEGRVLSEIFAT
jgi:hypothetical protein